MLNPAKQLTIFTFYIEIKKYSNQIIYLIFKYHTKSVRRLVDSRQGILYTEERQKRGGAKSMSIR